MGKKSHNLYRKYESVVILTAEFDTNEAKNWSLNKLARTLKKFKAKNIKLIFHGKLKLAYPINKQKTANYIQVNYLILPQFLKQFKKSLENDKYILRKLEVNSER